MKISYVGNFEPSHSTETHVAASLESIGHEVSRIQENQIGAGTLLRDVTNFGPDLFLWTRTWPGYVTPDILEQLKKLNITSVSYHLDLYVPIRRREAMADDPFWRTDFVFTPDGDPGSAKVFKQMGINHHYLRPGVYDVECKPGKFNAGLAADIIFIGSTYGYHPEWPYRQQLVNFLKETYGGWFRIFGSPFRSIRGQDLNDALASTKIVIGDSLCPGFKHKRYWSDRVYETTGRGGFIIHPRIVGLEKDFVEHEEIGFYNYGDFEHLKKLIDWYRSHDEYREGVRKKGWSRTISQHTYIHRMKEMLDALS